MGSAQGRPTQASGQQPKVVLVKSKHAGGLGPDEPAPLVDDNAASSPPRPRPPPIDTRDDLGCAPTAREDAIPEPLAPKAASPEKWQAKPRPPRDSDEELMDELLPPRGGVEETKSGPRGGDMDLFDIDLDEIEDMLA